MEDTKTVEPPESRRQLDRLVSQPLLFSLGEIAETTEPTKPKEGTPESTLDKYLQRTIRRVTLFLSQGEYDEVLTKAKRVCQKLGVTNHTDCFKKLIHERDET